MIYRAHVEHSFTGDGSVLYISRAWESAKGVHRREMMKGSIEWVDWPTATVHPTNSGLFLPDDAWETLVEFARPFGQGAGELAAIREALKKADTRVDLLLAAAISRIN